MNIAGVVVNTMPEHQETVRAALLALNGVEIHAQAGPRLVVTLEDDDGRRMADTVSNLHTLKGVLSAAMVYQYSDDGEEH